jgi:uncharacterized coiled-coil protein SlyX
MRERLEQRLQELKTEFGKGEQTLQGLEEQVAAVRQTLLRISGAIQVLDEELGYADQPQEDGSELSVEEAESADATGSASAPARRAG